MDAQQFNALESSPLLQAGGPPGASSVPVPPIEDPDAGKIEHGTRVFIQTNCALFASGLATFALLYCVQPLMPLFSESFSVSAAGASLSLSLTTALLAASILVAGALSETWGRKPLMVGSLVAASVLTLVSALLHQWEGFLIARALMGIALSGLPAVAMAYVGEEMHPRSLSLAMGLYVAGTGLGGMAGRLLAGVATDLWGWRVALMAMAALGLACAAIVAGGLPASRHFRRRPFDVRALAQTYAGHLRDRSLAPLFLEGFLLMGCFVTVSNYVSYRLVLPPFGLSHTQIGLIFILYLFGVVGSAWSGALSARVGRHRLLPVSLGLMLAGVLLTCSESLATIVAGIAVLTVGFFGTHSVASAWVGAQARVGRAQASSLYLFAYYLGSSVVGSVGGVFWSRGGWPGVASLTGTLLVLALWVAWRLRRGEVGASVPCAS